MSMTWKNAAMTGWMLAATAVTACVLIATIDVAYAQAPPAVAATRTASPQAQPGITQDALFDSWDRNHDKSISRDEFKAGWQQLEATMALRQLHEQFVVRDTSKSDCIDASEYAQLELVKKAGTSAPPLATFDADKNQCLNFKEYVGLIQSLLGSSSNTPPRK